MARGFTIDDLHAQLPHLEKLPDEWLRRIGADLFRDEDRRVVLDRIERIIGAMTPEQRQAPDSIDRPQLGRIAAASGATEEQVAHFLLQFLRIESVMGQVARMSLWQRIKLVLGWGKVPPPEADPPTAGQGPA